MAGGAVAAARPNWVMAKLNGLGCLEGSPVIAQSIMCSVLLTPLSAWLVCQKLCKCNVQTHGELNMLHKG